MCHGRWNDDQDNLHTLKNLSTRLESVWQYQIAIQNQIIIM